MARRGKNIERILGPYDQPRGWRVIHVARGGERSSQFFATEEEAKRAARALRRELERGGRTQVGEALDAYEVYMRHEKGNKLKSAIETSRRLRRFFPEHDVLLGSVTNAKAAGYYLAMTRWTKPDGKPISVDYHRNTLAEAR